MWPALYILIDNKPVSLSLYRLICRVVCTYGEEKTTTIAVKLYTFIRQPVWAGYPGLLNLPLVCRYHILKAGLLGAKVETFAGDHHELSREARVGFDSHIRSGHGF